MCSKTSIVISFVESFLLKVRFTKWYTSYRILARIYFLNRRCDQCVFTYSL